MKSYSQMKRSTLPVRSPLTREKGQQNQESRQPAQRDKSTKSVQETIINKTVSNQGSKRVNIIQGKTRGITISPKATQIMNCDLYEIRKCKVRIKGKLADGYEIGDWIFKIEI